MIRGNTAPHARRRLRTWLFAALAALPITAVLAATQYLYDDLGRLVLAANSDGSATVYSHDENGNVVTIIQVAGNGPFIGGFSPSHGHAGASVTIIGAGFSATPVNNAVTIGGVAATVSSATTTQIVATIPLGANTGPITVTVDGLASTSTQNITIDKPMIASFSPGFVAPGGSVTVTGANLNLVSGGTSLSVGGAAVTVTSLSDTQAVFTAPNNTGGSIVVTTPYGQATSAGSLVIVPASVGAANVVDYDNADPNGASQALAINQQNKVALLSFEAAASTYYSVQLDALTLAPSGGSINYTVYGPTGATFVSGTVSTTTPSIHLPQIVTAGRYLVGFNSGSKTSVQITARVELNTILTASDTTVSASTTGVYQSKRLYFSATAGDDLSLAITSVVNTPSTPNYVNVYVQGPSNQWVVGGFPCFMTSNPGCSWNLLNLPQTGTYRVWVELTGQATTSFSLTLSTDLTGALTAGTPLPVSLTVPGKMALLTFTATAGQVNALHMSSVSTTPAGKSMTMYVYNPSGGLVTQASSTTQATLNLTNLVAGTYSVGVVPSDAATGSATVTLANGLTGTLIADGTTQSFAATVPQQNGYFTFSATAGDDLALAITNLVLTPNSPSYVNVYVIRPNNQYIVGGYACYTTSTPGCAFNLLNLPQTGVYRVFIEIVGQQTPSFNATLSTDVSGALTFGTPLAVTLDSPGEQAWLSFTATAGQNVVLTKSSVVTTPSGKAVWMYVYNAAGTQIASSSSNTINLNSLSAGTYQVLVSVVDAATATLNVGVQ